MWRTLMSYHFRASANFMKFMNVCILCCIMSLLLSAFGLHVFSPLLHSFPPLFCLTTHPSCLQTSTIFLIIVISWLSLNFLLFFHPTLHILSIFSFLFPSSFQKCVFFSPPSRLSPCIFAPSLALCFCVFASISQPCLLSDHHNPRRGVCAGGQHSKDQVEGDQSHRERGHGPLSVFHCPTTKPGGHGHSQQVASSELDPARNFLTHWVSYRWILTPMLCSIFCVCTGQSSCTRRSCLCGTSCI